MSDSLTIKKEVDMIDIDNKVDAEKLINSIKNLKNGRVAKFVKMYICDGMLVKDILLRVMQILQNLVICTSMVRITRSMVFVMKPL